MPIIRFIPVTSVEIPIRLTILNLMILVGHRMQGHACHEPFVSLRQEVIIII